MPDIGAVGLATRAVLGFQRGFRRAFRSVGQGFRCDRDRSRWREQSEALLKSCTGNAPGEQAPAQHAHDGAEREQQRAGPGMCPAIAAAMACFH